MKTVQFTWLLRLLVLVLLPGPVGAVPTKSEAHAGLTAPAALTKEKKTMHAKGTFEVQLTPQDAATEIGVTKIGRMRIDKQFQGDLAASSLGEMLALRTDVQGSAGYVAMERVTGTLNGRSGSFVLQHSGTMNRGAASLALAVVPDSGSGELAGLTGTMTIDIDQGKHHYTMDYALAPDTSGTP
jgi:hypothetical protein